MNQNSKLLPAIIVVGLFALLFFAVGFFVGKEKYQSEEQLSGVSISHEYQATTTDQIIGGCKGDVDFLVAYNQFAGTTLGSITVVSTTPHVLRLKNATTTSANGFYTNSSSTVATLPANTPQGTYVFDAYLNKGLVLDFEAGFCGGYIITYR